MIVPVKLKDLGREAAWFPEVTQSGVLKATLIRSFKFVVVCDVPSCEAFQVSLLARLEDLHE
jgi:hypothetical protein